VVLAYGFDINAQLAGAVGRDPTLTDRTVIWKIVLGMHTNPVVGAGYESFWLGSRFEQVRQHFEAGINEAHNGYLDIYLSLGMIGVCLVAGLLIASYRKICKELASNPSVASLFLALWTIQLFYNMTESAFKWHLMWATFLLAAIAVPKRAEDRVPDFAAIDRRGTIKRFHGVPLETTSQGQ